MKISNIFLFFVLLNSNNRRAMRAPTGLYGNNTINYYILFSYLTTHYAAFFINSLPITQ